MTIDVTRHAVFWRRLFAGRGRAVAPEDGTLLGMSDRGTRVAWPSPSAARASHGLVLAGSGAGKTVLLAATALGELLRDRRKPKRERMAVFAADPKGDLVELLLTGIASECPEALSDVRYLDPFAETGGYPFNLAKIKRKAVPADVWAVILASLVGIVSTSIGDQKHLGTGQRQQDVLQHVLLAVADSDHPDANPLWALEALSTGKAGVVRLARATRSDRARQFLLSTDLGEELRASCAARLRSAFALTSGLARMTASPRCLDLDDCLAPGAITLANFARAPAGFVPLTAFQSNAFTRMVVDHLYARTSPWKGHHARLWLDEAQILAPVLSDVAERIFTTGRSFGISAVIASQGTALLKAAGGETLLRVLMTNAPMKLVGRLSAPDAELLSREQAPGAGVDTSLSEVRSRFVGAVTNLKDREFLRVLPGETTRLRSKNVDLEAWYGASTALEAALIATKRRLALDPDAEQAASLEAAIPDGAPRSAPSPRSRARGRRPRAEAAPTLPDAPSTPPTPKPRSKWG